MQGKTKKYSPVLVQLDSWIDVVYYDSFSKVITRLKIILICLFFYLFNLRKIKWQKKTLCK